MVGGALALLAFPMVRLVGPSAGSEPIDIVILAAVSFFAPAAVLSPVTPAVTKIRLETLSETGTVVGRLSAISTAGAIFGTFLAGFVLVAAWPSRTITVILGLLLIATGLALAVQSRVATTGLLATSALITFGAGAAAVGAPASCDYETAYFCVNVDVDPERESGRILWLDTLRHSYVDIDDPTYLEFRYAQIFGAVLDTHLPDGPASSLSIGGGGFTFPHYVAATHPGGTNTVLEIDPALVDIAEDRLGLDPDSYDIRTGDARLTLRETELGIYDVVIGDAFRGPAVPWHLTTVEFVEDFAACLTPDGFYVLNLIDYPPLGFARAQTVTLADVFEHVAVIAPANYLAGEAGGNFVLVASNGEIDAAAISNELTRRNSSADVISGAAVAEFIGDAEVLTDDFAPVDQLITN